MKVLITGTEGNLGSALLAYLQTKEDYLVVPFSGDVTDYWNWDVLVDDFDFIIHLAGIAGVRASLNDAEHYYNVNVGGQRNALSWAEKTKTKMIYASSSNVHEWWLNPYAATKKMCEALAVHKEAIGLRFHTIYPGRSDMLYSMLQSNDVYMLNIEHRRDYIHVYDVCTAIDLVMENFHLLRYEEWLDVGTGYCTSIVDVAKHLNYTGGYSDMETPRERIKTCADVKWLKLLGWHQTKDVLNRPLNQLSECKDAETTYAIWDLLGEQLDQELNSMGDFNV
tara:strand:- start:303 stop:1142 length:840 start_codon:yes stop_codon:yes gene_type:complete